MRHPVLSFAVVLAAAVLQVPAARADVTWIRALDVTQRAEVTRIQVRSSRSPAFTVYKLERPSRVVLDLPRAQLAEALTGHETAAVMTPATWAVSTIAAQQVEDGGSLVRLSVTLARPGRYEVKPDGNDLVLIITARDPAPATAADAGARLDAERVARLRAEQASAAAQKDAASARDVAAAAQKDAASARDVAAAAQKDAATAHDVASAARSEAERLRRVAAEQT